MKISKWLYIDLYNEWSQFFGRYNWINITPIQISFENDIHCFQYEFTVIILGLGFHITIPKIWNKHKKEFDEKLEGYVRAIREADWKDIYD